MVGAAQKTPEAVPEDTGNNTGLSVEGIYIFVGFLRHCNHLVGELSIIGQRLRTIISGVSLGTRGDLRDGTSDIS